MTATEIAKEIRAQLKREFPHCKFSVTTGPGRSITVALMEAPWQALKDGTSYTQLNHYYLKEDGRLSPQAKGILIRANKLANARNWDRSDSQVDYFDVNYYFDLHIGKWDKPFTVKTA